jgi:hypothetical protein
MHPPHEKKIGALVSIFLQWVVPNELFKIALILVRKKRGILMPVVQSYRLTSLFVLFDLLL